MAKSTTARVRPKLLTHLGDPDLREIISAEKLSRSWQLIASLRVATVGALSHGDTTDICKLLRAFEGNPYQARLVRWFEDRCGFTITFVKDSIQVKRRPGSVPRERSELEYFPEATRAFAARESLDKAERLAKKGMVASSESTCLMERGRRLPGSFEGGKRR